MGAKLSRSGANSAQLRSSAGRAVESVATPHARSVHAAGTRRAAALPQSKTEHNAIQAEYFARELEALESSITPSVEACLASIAQAVPGLAPGSRVLDVGAGTGALIPHLRARGVQDVLALDVCPEMLDRLRSKFGADAAGGELGNEPGVRTWVGELGGLPGYQGPFDAAFFNAVFGNLHDPRADLLRAALLTRPGGHVVVSHPLGRTWHERYRCACLAGGERQAVHGGQPRCPHAPPAMSHEAHRVPLRCIAHHALLGCRRTRHFLVIVPCCHAVLRRAANPAIVPHSLPDRAELEALLADLPLRLVELRDEARLYLALLQVGCGGVGWGGVGWGGVGWGGVGGRACLAAA
jgi:SAM-dependent methyltransferase